MEVNQGETSLEIPEGADPASPAGHKSKSCIDSDVKIVKILTQIEKLRIIWYKTLKKLKLIEELKPQSL